MGFGVGYLFFFSAVSNIIVMFVLWGLDFGQYGKYFCGVISSGDGDKD